MKMDDPKIDRDLLRKRRMELKPRDVVNIDIDRDIMELKKYRDLIEPKKLEIKIIEKRKLIL